MHKFPPSTRGELQVVYIGRSIERPYRVKRADKSAPTRENGKVRWCPPKADPQGRKKHQHTTDEGKMVRCVGGERKCTAESVIFECVGGERQYAASSSMNGTGHR